MHRFLILSADESYKSSEIISPDAGSALHTIGRLNVREADVLQDDRYLFSAYLNGNGVWCIFQRGHGPEGEAVSAFG
jgi:hypothetical protein